MTLSVENPAQWRSVENPAQWRSAENPAKWRFVESPAKWREESPLLLVRGAKCSGKTVFLGAVGDAAAESGALVLRATGWPSEHGLRFGVLRQLLNRLAESGAAAPQDGGAAASRDGGAPGPLSHEQVLRQFLDVTASRPLLVVVDDIGHVDPASQDFLRFLARRLEGTSIRIALAERTGEVPARCRDLSMDVVWLPHTQVVQLGPLTHERLAEWIAACAPVGPAVARQLAARIHEVGGGNVLLSRILLEKHLAADAGLQADADFQDAVRTIVDGSGVPALRRGARAAALLGRHCTPRRLARLLRGDSVAADGALRMLRHLGMLHGTQVRQRIGQALVDDHEFTDRAGMHLEAAHALFDDGLPPAAVTHHLSAAGRLAGPWHPPLVLELVRRLLETGDTGAAETVLRLVRTSTTSADEYLPVELLLLRGSWLDDPSLTAALVPSVVAAAHRGALRSADVAFLVRVTTVHGFPDEADALLSLLRERPPEPGAHGEVLLAEVLHALWQGGTPHQQPLVDLMDLGARAESAERLAVCRHPWLRNALHKIPRLLEAGDRAGVILAAEQILEDVRGGTSTVEPFLAAWWALATVNALPLARRSCAALHDALGDSPSPLWRALLCLLQARCAMAVGDLADAYAHLRTALRHKPWDAWGSLTGALGASLVEVLTEMGRHEEAADVLELPLHPAAFRGMGGLLYTRARGRHRLATGQLPGALSDFEACRDACALLGRELPMLLPWRCDIAETCLRTDDVQEARRLLEEQLAVLPAEASDVRGTALRLLARTHDTGKRIRDLETVARQLERHGNRLQLAYTLADLADAYQETSRLRLARTTIRRAQRIARSCEAGRLGQLITVDGVFRAQEDDPPAGSRADLLKLSSAERRVAFLAVQGHTNREISERLFITASTVEQHLTRIYRKLEVRRREDLRTRYRTVFTDLETPA